LRKRNAAWHIERATYRTKLGFIPIYSVIASGDYKISAGDYIITAGDFIISGADYRIYGYLT